MAFDAALISQLAHELDCKLRGAKIEKIHQPERDEIVLLMKQGKDTQRLLINAGSTSPRMCLSENKSENPASPPMLCMILRKYLGGAKIERIEQPDFERAVRITFSCYDELGYPTTRHIIAELMGKYCNIIFTDADDKILYVLKPIDFCDSDIRQLMVGMIYTLPPKQNKLDPRYVTRDEFYRLAQGTDSERSAAKFIQTNFSGLATSNCTELAYLAGGSCDATMQMCERRLWEVFDSAMTALREYRSVPTVVTLDGRLSEYGFLDYRQYGKNAELSHPETFSAMIDTYFAERAKSESLRTRAADIFRLLNAAETRILKKIERQNDELVECGRAEEYKLSGDLITANIYRMKKGARSAVLENYYAEMKPVEIELNERLTPAQNAAAYYKKYTKMKSAKEHLTEQLRLSQAELDYIYSVFDSLTRADGERELSEIREELFHSGYASKMKNYSRKKSGAPTVLKFKTDGGYTVLCGKNNLANDYITLKLAERGDWWFHAKNVPGSHVLMQVTGNEEPPERDFTQAAEIAAYYSKASGGENIAVDYMRAREVKKPSGSKPGFVIYRTNWTAYVTPSGEKIAALLVK